MPQTELILTGEDARVYLDSALEAKVATDAKVVGNFYRVTAKGGSSTHPAGTDVNDWYIATATTALATGDTADMAAPSEFTDATGFTVSINKGEIETTRLSDIVKSYRAGKTDMSGTISFNRTIDALASTGQLARNAMLERFMNVITQDGTTVVSSGGGTDTLLWLFLYTNESDTTAGNIREIFILPVRVTSTEANASVDSAQTATYGFRVDGAYKPCVLQYVNQ